MMRGRKLKTFAKSLLAIVFTVVSICVLTFIGVPVYRFTAGAPFSGTVIYNPYEGIDSSRWIKANFHAHQREKPKCNYTEEEMFAVYRASGYDVMSLSDHQYINRSCPQRPGFIPTYEHGYGLNRYHQLMMGAEKVSWRDFPLMLTQSQMQYLLHELRPQTRMLVLNHPGQTRLIDHGVYARLRGYDLLEINPERGEERSNECWDTALSAGIYANLIGNDDAHAIAPKGRNWFQRCFTMLNTPSLSPDDMMEALRKGRSYAVSLPREANLWENPHADLPSVEHIGFENDTISIVLDRPAAEIRFIGQNGKTAAVATDTATARCAFAAEDTYIRTEATFPDGVMIFTNPFVRTNGTQPVNEFVPQIDYPASVAVHVGWIALACVSILTVLRLSGVRFRRAKARPE